MAARLDTRPSATTMDLADLVKQVWLGRIRIPHFQRDYRWAIDDVAKLFDSIVRGYPIGSLLLWVRHAPAAQIKLGALSIDAPAIENAFWVVDGQQRITSLANALHVDGAADSRFSLSYDLDNKAFVRSTAHMRSLAVPLHILFDLQKLIEWFASRPDITGRLPEASAVTAAIHQFKIPAYQVTSDNTQILQDIFDRMNNYGKRLRRAEVFSALFAGDEAARDTTLTIDRISEEIATERGFGEIDDGTVLRSILARRGSDVDREIRNEFDTDRNRRSDFPTDTRDDAYMYGSAALRRAVEFLQEGAGVPHIAFVPYRFLIVVLARLFAHHPSPDPRNRQLLRRWYWRAALIGTTPFKGGTVGATRSYAALVNPHDLSASLRGLLGALDPARSQIPNIAKFRTNDAASKVLLGAMWSLGPRSFTTGQPFSIADIANSIPNGSTTAAEAMRFIRRGRAVPEQFSKSAANRILMPADDIDTEQIDQFLLAEPIHLNHDSWLVSIESHAITEDAARHLTMGDEAYFYSAREALLKERLTAFLQRVCEWEFEDTPPLSEFVIDDEDDDENG